MILRRDRAMTAVLIMLDVAFHAGRSNAVSAADIAERSGLAAGGLNRSCRHSRAQGCWKVFVAPVVVTGWAAHGVMCP